MGILSDRQQQIFDFIKKCCEDGRSPSIREICDATGLKSPSTAHHHLNALESKGLIERERGARSIRVVGEEKPRQIPILGRVTAGLPILAVEDIEGYIPVRESFIRGRDLFALRIDGESMINAGIYNGDVVIINKTPVAENGSIVIAMVGDEATCKRFYKENGHYRLQPENDDFEPIIVDEVDILGTVVSLFRNYE